MENNNDKFASLSASDYMQKLPSSAANGFFYIILAMIVATITWSIIGTTDIVVSAKGILAPKGEAKEVFSDNTGIVIKLFVKEGQEVKKGEPLLQLNSSSSADLSSEIQKIKSSIILKNSELKVKQEYLIGNKNELRRTLNISKKQLVIKKNKISVAKSSLERIKKQYQIRSDMYKNNLISKLELLKEEDSYEKAQNNLKELNLELNTFKIQSSQNKEQLETKITTTKLELNQISSQIKDLDRELNLLSMQIDKGSDAMSYDTMRSPINGIISKSMIKHEADYVKAGSVLFEIIPKNQPLIAKIEIPNTGIGRISKQMRVKIKYDAYPYQQYGIGEGKIVYISSNSRLVNEQSQEFVFDSVVELNNKNLDTKSGKFPLFPGLTIQAEIVVEQKQLIQFVAELMVGQK